MLIVQRRVMIEAPRPAVAAYLRDISHLAEYEQKVETCEASYPREGEALASVHGTWYGFRWSGVFEMNFTPDGGFQSRMIRGPLKRMSGGFALKEVTGGTQLTHHELYGFPWFVRPFYPLLRPWLARSMELELEVIKKRSEELSRSLVA